MIRSRQTIDGSDPIDSACIIAALYKPLYIATVECTESTCITGLNCTLPGANLLTALRAPTFYWRAERRRRPRFVCRSANPPLGCQLRACPLGDLLISMQQVGFHHTALNSIVVASVCLAELVLASRLASRDVSLSSHTRAPSSPRLGINFHSGARASR